jgi:DNA-binding MarR family transcriptional regulator
VPEKRNPSDRQQKRVSLTVRDYKLAEAVLQEDRALEERKREQKGERGHNHCDTLFSFSLGLEGNEIQKRNHVSKVTMLRPLKVTFLENSPVIDTQSR